MIQSVIKIAKQAGLVIMEVYKTDFDIQIKNDKSPVTEADTRANEIIIDGLLKITPDIPILSEEGRDIPYEERSKWESFWLVDPLDGTKEYIKKNDEFTVNIAYMQNNLPIFGVVYAPALDELYWGNVEKGAYKSIAGKTYNKINVRTQLNSPVQIATSRSHPSPKMDKFLSQFKSNDLHPMGSSLKICSVADGRVHFYPRLGPTMEWDTGASHAVIKAAGGEIIKYGTNKPLKYNKEDLLNPEFIAGNLNSIESLN
ncbi:MAG: 3'(2'),5'-bisphosphate nucleotidase CysQ [Candidatus Marinimicrobia bacterium]|nr:3'(2'),5'-bisphosphate nucleotidase CysQ [Candidatus Neomarinimicrobiota bacterium]